MKNLERKTGEVGTFIIIPESDYSSEVPQAVAPIFQYEIEGEPYIPTWHERYLYDNSAKEARQLTIKGVQYRIVEVNALSHFFGNLSEIQALAPNIDLQPDYCVVINKQDLISVIDYYEHQ